MAVNNAVIQSKAVISPSEIGANQGAGSAARQPSNLSFMHRAPTIMPNYGKTFKPGLKLKTNVPRVLLYDNLTQQSILCAQISGIQSQSYRTRRQLEMSIKSFLLRKKHKDKALRKLTKVHHADDYAKFELEYCGYTWDTNGCSVEGNHMKRLTLPSIHAEKGAQMPVRNLRRSLRNRNSTVFPEVTKMFPVISTNEEVLSPLVEDEPAALDKQTKTETATLLAENVIYGKNTSSEKVVEANMCPKLDRFTGNVPSAKERQPILDRRFELLKEILVPQDPPNEGFAELSPSFIKPAPFQFFRERSVFLAKGDRYSGASMNTEGVNKTHSEQST